MSWNKRVPEEKQKSRPEFLELSHKLNIGNFRNISIQRAKPKPEKPAEEKEKANETKSEKKPENEKKPGEELNKGKTADPPKPEPKSAPKDNSSFKLEHPAGTLVPIEVLLDSLSLTTGLRLEVVSVVVLVVVCPVGVLLAAQGTLVVAANLDAVLVPLPDQILILFLWFLL